VKSPGEEAQIPSEPAHIRSGPKWRSYSYLKHLDAECSVRVRIPSTYQKDGELAKGIVFEVLRDGVAIPVSPKPTRVTVGMREPKLQQVRM
jgi:hypothetical protein